MWLFPRQITAICLFLFGIIATSGAANAAPQEIRRSNAPNATLSSIVQARSLAMLCQVVMQLEHHVQSKDLSAIHNEDVILAAAGRELLAQADAIASNQSDDFKASLTAFCSRVSALHVVADLNQQAKSETELGKVLESFVRVKAYFPNEVVAQAQIYLETFTCPMHRDIIGKRTDSLSEMRDAAGSSVPASTFQLRLSIAWTANGPRVGKHCGAAERGSTSCRASEVAKAKWRSVLLLI